MTCERGSRAESKNCENLVFPTADRRFDTKVKCPTGWASFWVKFPTVRSSTRVKCPGIARGGMGGFGIDWYITSRKLYVCLEAVLCFLQLFDRAYASPARCIGLVPQWSFWHHMIKMKLFTFKSVDCFACWSPFPHPPILVPSATRLKMSLTSSSVRTKKFEFFHWLTKK